MIRIAFCLFCLIPFSVAAAAAEHPPEFGEAYKNYTELMDKGEERAAIPYARKALEIAVKSDAFTDEERGKLAFNLGFVLYIDNQLSASVDAFGQAIAFFDKAGGDRKLKAEALIYRGICYQGLFRYEEAQVELEHALELLTGPGRNEQLARAEALETLAWVEIALRRSNRAEDYAAEAHATLSKLLGENHPRTLYSLLALSAANYARGHHPKARDQMAHALAVADKAGMAEPGTKAGPMQFTRQQFIQFHRRVALLYKVMGQKADAEYHRKIVADLRKGTAPPNLRVKPIKRTPPHYPDRAIRQRIMGWVIAEYTVRKDGSTADIRIVDSTPKGIFDFATIRAIKRWEYEPCIENGKAVDVKNIRTLIEFRLYR